MGWIGRLAGAAGLAACFAAAQPAFGETLVVFAAASTANVIDELAQRFEAANSGIEVLTSFAASSIPCPPDRQRRAGGHLFVRPSPVDEVSGGSSIDR